MLKHIKHTNPAQAVVLYSAQRQNVTSRDALMLADEVMEKRQEYVAFKQVVDDLLKRRYTRGYFIAAMNRVLAEDAALVPFSVWKANRALRTRRTAGLEAYLRKHLRDTQKIDRVLTIISIGTGLAGLV